MVDPVNCGLIINFRPDSVLALFQKSTASSLVLMIRSRMISAIAVFVERFVASLFVSLEGLFHQMTQPDGIANVILQNFSSTRNQVHTGWNNDCRVIHLSFRTSKIICEPSRFDPVTVVLHSTPIPSLLSTGRKLAGTPKDNNLYCVSTGDPSKQTKTYQNKLPQGFLF
jgi:hypothetical protein